MQLWTKKLFLKSFDLTEIQIVHHNNLFPSSRRQKQNQNSASLKKIQESKVFVRIQLFQFIGFFSIAYKIVIFLPTLL